MDMIQAHNDGEDGYSLGINKFADMSSDEFNQMLGLKLTPDTGEEDDEFNSDPDSTDS